MGVLGDSRRSQLRPVGVQGAFHEVSRGFRGVPEVFDDALGRFEGRSR